MTANLSQLEDSILQFLGEANALLDKFDLVQAIPRAQTPPHTGLKNQKPGWSDWDYLKCFFYRKWGLGGLARVLGDMEDSLKDCGLEDKRLCVSKDLEQELPLSIPLLASIHPEVLLSFLEGDITRRMDVDPDFAAILQRYHNLTVHPGNYLLAICQRAHTSHHSVTLVNERNPDAGKWLSRRMIRKVVKKTRLYFEMGQESAKYAELVDTKYPGATKEDKNINWDDDERRWYLKEDTVDAWLECLEKMTAGYDQLTENEKTEALTRCLFEFGYGQNCKERSDMHVPLHGIQNLLGLYFSILEVEYDGLFEIRQIQLFRIWEGAQGKIGEMLGSLLGNTYWLWGGLNPSLSGNVGLEKKLEKGLIASDLLLANLHRVIDDGVIVESFKADVVKVQFAKEVLEYESFSSAHIDDIKAKAMRSLKGQIVALKDKAELALIRIQHVKLENQREILAAHFRSLGLEPPK